MRPKRSPVASHQRPLTSTTSHPISRVRFDDIQLTLNHLKLDQKITSPVLSSTSGRHYHVPNGRLVRGFVGRNTILQKIEAVFSSERGYGPHIVVLRGLGGQGKTQIALEYCRQAREEGMGAIFWVDATSVDTVKNSFRTIADRTEDRDEL